MPPGTIVLPRPILSLQNVTLASGGYKVLDNISYDFPEGKTTVIMGPSGCGKTTALKVAAGIKIPDCGCVVYRGIDMSAMNKKEYMKFRKTSGFVFQDAALWSNSSIYQNLQLPLQLHFPELRENERKSMIQKAIERIQFTDPLENRPAQLSSGERKMIAFTRALITNPDCVFLDEPVNFIDSLVVDTILSILNELKQQNKTIIAVSHDTRIASLLADYLVIMKKGIIIDSGSVEEIRNSTNDEVIEVVREV